MKTPLLIFAVVLSFTSTSHAGGAGDEPGTEIYFRTPSKNIGCAYVSNENILVCERIKPKYARVEIANAVEWRDETGGTYSAHEPSAFVLGYGKKWTTPDGFITCISKPSGLKCVGPDGFGFLLSKAHVSSFDSKGHEIR
jgi:hypothetical protein